MSEDLLARRRKATKFGYFFKIPRHLGFLKRCRHFCVWSDYACVKLGCHARILCAKIQAIRYFDEKKREKKKNTCSYITISVLKTVDVFSVLILDSEKREKDRREKRESAVA
jgi:hypothetical protein